MTEIFTGIKLPLLKKNDPAEEERLLKLFWNRAELKKELSSLDDELYQLKDKLKQQESANTRLLEQNEELEALLGHPERCWDALVHFGLKGLWRACRAQLEQFGADLKRQQQDKERRRQLAEFQQDRQERLALAERRLAEAQAALDVEQMALASLRGEHDRRTGFWHYFKRRELARDILSRQEAVAGAQRHLDDFVLAQRTIEKEPWPEFAGLSVDGRRLINLAVIAYAQLLYARLADLGLAAPAHAANSRSVHDARYGSRDRCLARLTEVHKALALVRSAEGFVAEVRTRTEQVRIQATFRHGGEVVPTPESLPATGTRTGKEANVLIDDYWDVYKLLLH